MANLVKVSYMGLVRNTVGLPEEVVALPDGARVRDLLAILQKKHGDDFRYSLFSPNGQLRSMSRVFIGEREIGELEGMDTPLEPDSGVSILMLVYATEGG